MQLHKLTPTGKASTVTVDDAVFGVSPNPILLSQVVRVYQSNIRQATSKTKSRGEIKRTTKKWYKQKGTGGARHGARSAPIFVGGGVAHGPTGKQHFSLSLPKKVRRVAVCQALSYQCERTVVSDMPLELGNKTKHAQEFLRTVRSGQERVLIIADASERQVFTVFANIQRVDVYAPDQVTTHTLLLADKIILTTAAVRSLEKRLAKPTTPTQKLAKVPAVKSAESKQQTKVAVTKSTAAAPATKKSPATKTTVKASSEKKPATQSVAKTKKATVVSKTAKKTTKTTGSKK